MLNHSIMRTLHTIIKVLNILLWLFELRSNADHSVIHSCTTHYDFDACFHCANKEKSCFLPCVERNSFIHCDSGNTMTFKTCPADLYWDQDEESCVWYDMDGHPNSNKDVHLTVHGVAVACTVFSQFPCSECTNDHKFESDPDNACVLGCPEPFGFIHCNKDHHTMSIKTCPKHTFWSNIDMACKSEHTYNYLTDGKGEICKSCTRHDRYNEDPNNPCFKYFPGDETKYLMCVGPIIYEMPCPRNMVWNQNALSCSVGEWSPCKMCTDFDRYQHNPNNACYLEGDSDNEYIICDHHNNHFTMNCPESLHWHQKTLSCM